MLCFEGMGIPGLRPVLPDLFSASQVQKIVLILSILHVYSEFNAYKVRYRYSRCNMYQYRYLLDSSNRTMLYNLGMGLIPDIRYSCKKIIHINFQRTFVSQSNITNL